MKISDVIGGEGREVEPPPDVRGDVIWHTQRALAIRPQLLEEEYRVRVEDEHAHPLTGHCYNATVVLRELFGPAWWQPMFVEHENTDHWFLKNFREDIVVDATAVQFWSPVPHYKAERRSLLPQEPSERLQEVIEVVQAHY